MEFVSGDGYRIHHTAVRSKLQGTAPLFAPTKSHSLIYELDVREIM